MKAAIVSPIYPPEPVVSARTSYQIASEMCRLGHDVTVITSYPNRPGGKLYAGYRRRVRARVEAGPDGIKTIRTFSFFSVRSTIISRLAENLSFAISSGIQLFRITKPDVIYANTWPIFGQMVVALVAKIRNIPYVLSIQDLYPESMVNQTRFREGSLFVNLLYRIDRWVADQAGHLIVISDYFKARYIQVHGIESGKISTIPNWIDISPIPSFDADIDLRDRYGIHKDRILIVYGGNIGMASGVFEYLKMFIEINDPRFVLVIAGDGSELAKCQTLVADQGSNKVKFITPWLKDETKPLLSTADILLLPTLADQSFSSVPSKLLTYLEAGKPILGIMSPSSEIAEIIAEAECGWILDSFNPKLHKNWMQQMDHHQGTLWEMGSNARDVVILNFSEDILLPKVITLLGQTALQGCDNGVP